MSRYAGLILVLFVLAGSLPAWSQQFLEAPQFAVGTPEGPESVAVGDFNGDGKMDVAVTNSFNSSGNTVTILLGNGNGTFQSRVDYPTGTFPQAVAVGDFNGDKKQDLAIANNSGNTVSVLLGNGDGTFQAHVDYMTGAGPVGVAIGDFNKDGKQDLAVAIGTRDW